MHYTAVVLQCKLVSGWVLWKRKDLDGPGWFKIKYPNTKITTSQKCVNTVVLNFALLLYCSICRRQLSIGVLLCAVLAWHTPYWRKRKLRERILQLYKRLILLLKAKVIDCPNPPLLWHHCDVGLWWSLNCKFSAEWGNFENKLVFDAVRTKT